jgi:tRNA nucleotidyltransferase (CCA-adding enzyme)
MIKEWAGDCLNDIQISGSRAKAKGTAINISSDLDLFVSLKSTTNNTLKEIYDSLFSYISSSKGINCRKQNVSIGINYGGHSIDLVPGKKHVECVVLMSRVDK